MHRIVKRTTQQTVHAMVRWRLIVLEQCVLDEFRMNGRDWAALALFAGLAGGATWAGR